jgi:glutaminase
MDYQRILDDIREEVRPLLGEGRVAEYIQPLAQVPKERFGMVLRTVEGDIYATGDANERFSIQSIAKVFALTLAMRLDGDGIWERVGREPSGSAFNSLVQLEIEAGIPRNPLINAGALVVLDAILAHTPEDADLVLDFVRRAAGDESIGYDLAVAREERHTGHRNHALAHFLKSFGNLRADADRVLDAYFRLCSISMSCVELASAFLYLATGGRAASGREIALPRQVKRVNAVMQTCGAYDESGDYAYRIGLPAKSGVGGGVVAVMPGKFAVAVWSPGLSKKGNSLAGTMALELLTTKTAISIF